MKIVAKSLFLTFILLVTGFSYAYADTMQGSNPMHDKMMHDKNAADSSMMKQNMMMNTPLYQIKHGISIHDVKCATGFSLIFRASDSSPACVKSSSVSMLVARGWAQGDVMGMMMNHTMTDMKNSTSSHGIMNQTMGMNDHMMDKPMMDENNTMNNTMSNDTTKENSMPIEKQSNMHMAKIDKSQFKKSPGLLGITGYFNTTPEELQKNMKGKVVLYNFWTRNCSNCIHEIPFVNAWNAKYADKGLLIIGVHSPETEFEKDPNNVKEAVGRYSITYPVALDTNFETWNAFGNHYWPRAYLVDSDGYIRYDHIGEGNYDETEKEIQTLLAENKNS